MISIIIPSRSAVALTAISENIAKTIGVPFEIIDYDNTVDGFGICKIYNLCAQKAQFENLVFCHDDIVFHSHNWGIELINLLQQEAIGLVGVAGAIYKSKYPLSWVAVDQDCYRSNAFYEGDDTQKNKIQQDPYFEVAVVDGMFLGMTVETWQKYKFNESVLEGFHLYDIDLSYRIFRNSNIVVSNEILVEHKSRGNFNLNWFVESIHWHKNKNLPIYIENLTPGAIENLEGRSHALYLNNLIYFGVQTADWHKEFFRLCLRNNKLYFGILYKMFKKYVSKFKFLVNKTTAPYRKHILNWVLHKRVKNTQFCLISNNCWAGDIYEALNIKYNTPFIGLFVNAPCYIKLLKEFKFYMNCELTFKKTSKYEIENVNYPIGILHDIEIHFLHYKSEEEAYDKWVRRKERMPINIQNYIYKMDDRDFATQQEINDFHALNYSNKISFTKVKYDFIDNVKLKSEDDMILLYSTYGLTDHSILINKGKVRNSFINKLISGILRYPSKWL